MTAAGRKQFGERTGTLLPFDLDLLGINPESLQVQFHPAALATGYYIWDGKLLLYSKVRPSQVALEFRWKLFQSRFQLPG